MRRKFGGFLLFVLGCTLFIWTGVAFERTSPVSMADFKELYYGARCLLQHSDPYKESDLLHVYEQEGGDKTSEPVSLRRVVTLYINIPTAFLISLPFGMMPWNVAHLLWMIFTAVSFISGAFLIWSSAADKAPTATGWLICILMWNSEVLLEVGNVAGIIIGFCVIAVWCFLTERFVVTGIVLLAVSFLVKPHVAGVVWLYFILAGGYHRKRALCSLAIAILLGLPMVLWIGHLAPHWYAELSLNLRTFSAHGNLGDPGPMAVDTRAPNGATIIDLRSAISFLCDDPRIYKPLTYLICTPLLLVWAIATARKRFSQESAWAGLATIAALSMLPFYHRSHDTRLLLLALPAFASLWIKEGMIKWLSLAFTAPGALMIGNFPGRLLALLGYYMRRSAVGLSGRLFSFVLIRPVPLILLAMGIFYLWTYVRYNPDPQGSTTPGKSEQALHTTGVLESTKCTSA